MTTETYSAFCAPTVVAALLGDTPLEAARLLEAEGAAVGNGATSGVELDRILRDLGGRCLHGDELGDRQAYDKACRDWRRGRRLHRPSRTLLLPTVASALRELPRDQEHVLMTTEHIVAARDGQVLIDTVRTRSGRARVWRIYSFPAGTLDPTPLSHVRPTAVHTTGA